MILIRTIRSELSSEPKGSETKKTFRGLKLIPETGPRKHSTRVWVFVGGTDC